MTAKGAPFAAILVVLAASAEAQPLAPPGAAGCSGCHAPPRSGSPVPPVHGREAGDIVRAMLEFRTGARPATVMDRIAKGFSEAETEAIAAWLAAQR